MKIPSFWGKQFLNYHHTVHSDSACFPTLHSLLVNLSEMFALNILVYNIYLEILFIRAENENLMNI